MQHNEAVVSVNKLNAAQVPGMTSYSILLHGMMECRLGESLAI